ncbi:MAG: MoxR family ATPase [Cyanobacteria bacterium SZAS-4]|nr:MoxR family ATPase [Cyanobacteria bacterium SZAS-4]
MSNSMYLKQKQQLEALFEQLGVIKGQHESKKIIVATILGRGNAYLLSPPGLAKTTLVKVLQKTIANSVARRVQMTFDVRPRDIVGYPLFDQATQKNVFIPGPLVDANIVLIDEISRGLGLTHAALLEAMQEGTITHVEKVGAIKLPDFFAVLATANPLESEGVNPLPEALRDRFMTQVEITYGSRDDELAMLTDLAGVFDATKNVKEVMTVEDILEAQSIVFDIAQSASLEALLYILDLNRAARPNTDFFNEVHGNDAERLSGFVGVGPSPRGEIATLMIAAALVLIEGDDYIEPKHIKEAFRYTLPMRVIMRPEASIDSFTVHELVRLILERVAVIDK